MVDRQGRVFMRCTDADKQVLKDVCEHKGMSEAEVIRHALHLFHSELVKRGEIPAKYSTNDVGVELVMRLRKVLGNDDDSLSEVVADLVAAGESVT